MHWPAMPDKFNDRGVVRREGRLPRLYVPDKFQASRWDRLAKVRLDLPPCNRDVALLDRPVQSVEHDQRYEVQLAAGGVVGKETTCHPLVACLSVDSSNLAEPAPRNGTRDVRAMHHTTHIMTPQTSQRGATIRATISAVERAAELRAALLDDQILRREATLVLDVLPSGCDLIAWSPEGFTVAAVASVLAREQDREVRVHRASLLAPLAASPRLGAGWTWVTVEELLGLGHPRSWAIHWAEARGGQPHRGPVLVT